MSERTELKIPRTTQTMQQLTDSDIKEFLENAPLYVWREFRKPVRNRESLWIREIDAFCEECKQPRPFQDLRPRGAAAGMAAAWARFGDAIPPDSRSRGGDIGSTDLYLKTGISHFEFTCVSCGRSKREYHVEQIVDGETIRFQKYGERPRKRLERNPALQRFLKDDLDNYEKAVVCLSNGYGVAAFAYFRRVVENNINGLLDLVQEDAQSSSADAQVTAALAELRNDSPMKEKIKIANHALPAYLNPDGLNPLGRLYQVLSEAVHNFPEEECLSKAKATSDCLAYLVSELASRKEHRTRFKSTVGGL